MTSIAAIRPLEWSDGRTMPFELTCELLEHDLLWYCDDFNVDPAGHRQFTVLTMATFEGEGVFPVIEDEDGNLYPVETVALRIECDVEPRA